MGPVQIYIGTGVMAEIWEMIYQNLKVEETHLLVSSDKPVLLLSLFIFFCLLISLFIK